MFEGGGSESQTPPLQGFLVDESDKELRVGVTHGVWIIDRADVESLSDWEDPIKADFDGRPVQVVTRPGATLGFLQSVKVQPVDRPMTLSEQGARIFGSDQLQRMTQAWGGKLGFEVALRARARSPSASCWDSPGGWGMTCAADDCMD
jgi:hypothetical protein